MFLRIAFSILPGFGLEPAFATGIVCPFKPLPCFKLEGGFGLVRAFVLVPLFELRPSFALVLGAFFFVLMNSLSFFHRQRCKL